ncbi:MAG: M48 family metallopeptidase [Candidatus Omnitrophica bacterium]|nr:M48 family metallopeptidase [Candidatus Omnitrophota bacterium]
MLSRSRLNNFILLSFCAILLSGCVTIYNPATEKRETLLIDTPGEISLGRDMDKQLQYKLKILQDPQTQPRLDSIGSRVAGASDRQDLAYAFRIVKDKELNAFAIPGGYVYLNSGLLDVASDDELACVLAHEIGHIAARHSVKRLQTVLGYQLIMGIALGISGQQAMGSAVDVVFNLASQGYSRNDEFLADKLSVRYSRKAGFNPYGMVSFFEKLKKEAQKRGPNFTPVFLSSHPPIEERIKKVEEEMARNPS